MESLPWKEVPLKDWETAEPEEMAFLIPRIDLTAERTVLDHVFECMLCYRSHPANHRDVDMICCNSCHMGFCPPCFMASMDSMGSNFNDIMMCPNCEKIAIVEFDYLSHTRHVFLNPTRVMFQE